MFSTKTYVVGTKKYCLNDTVSWAPNIIKQWMHIGLPRLQYFVKGHTNSKNRNDSVYMQLHNISVRRTAGLL